MEWVSGVSKVVFIWRKVVSWWGFAEMGGFGAEFPVTLLKRAVLAAVTCILAFGGAFVGGITGAITGQTTETGFLRGAGIGAVSGAIVALELPDSMIEGHFLSKVALFGSLINGKVFREWVSPAMLRAYQWQTGMVEVSYGEVSDIFDVSGTKGMSPESIEKLPVFSFHCAKMTDPCNEICCTICLQDFKERECARRLPICGHFFHFLCIDEWLARNGSCPVCRQDV